MFGLEIAFTGLCLICVEGACAKENDFPPIPTDTKATVYLVNAWGDKHNVCGETVLHGHHRPVLTFEIDDVLESHHNEPIQLSLAADGGWLGHLELSQLGEDLNFCFETDQTPGISKKEKLGNSKPLPVDKDAWNWLATVQDVDKSAKLLSKEIEGKFPNNRAVAAFRLKAGELVTTAHPLDLIESKSGNKEWEYIEWEVDELGETDNTDDFLRAISDVVTLRLQSGLEKVVFKRCSSNLPLITFKASDGMVNILVSNLPPPSNDSSRSLKHFRWYYQLFTHEETEPCGILKQFSPPRLTANTYCPPASAGGG